jgi:hypothetical protein
MVTAVYFVMVSMLHFFSARVVGVAQVNYFT